MIDTENLVVRGLLRDLRRVVLRLTLVSHVSAVSYDSSGPSADEDIGGKRPTGGIDRLGDRELAYRQKSAVFFQRRLDWMLESKAAYTTDDLLALIREAEEAVDAWQRTPDVSGVKDLEPEPKSFLWKCDIADDDRPMDVILRAYDTSPASVYRYRATHRGLRKRSV